MQTEADAVPMQTALWWRLAGLRDMWQLLLLPCPMRCGLLCIQAASQVASPSRICYQLRPRSVARQGHGAVRIEPPLSSCAGA